MNIAFIELSDPVDVITLLAAAVIVATWAGYNIIERLTRNAS